MKTSQLKDLLYKKVSGYYPGRLKELTVLNIKMNSTVRVKVAPLFDIRNVSLEPTVYTRCDSYETSFKKDKELKVVVNPSENFIIAIIDIDGEKENTMCFKYRKEESCVKSSSLILDNSTILSHDEEFENMLNDTISVVNQGRDPHKENKDRLVKEKIQALYDVCMSSPLFEKTRKDERSEEITITLKRLESTNVWEREIDFKVNENNELVRVYSHYDFCFTVSEETIAFMTNHGADLLKIKNAYDEVRKAEKL